MKILLILTAIVAVVGLSQLGDSSTAQPLAYADVSTIVNAKGVDYVKQVCDKAHRENNGASEELCGQLQDQTGTEYLCGSTSVNALCWVEVK